MDTTVILQKVLFLSVTLCTPYMFWCSTNFKVNVLKALSTEVHVSCLAIRQILDTFGYDAFPMILFDVVNLHSFSILPSPQGDPIDSPTAL